MKVRDVMTSPVVSVPPTMRLKELARLLSERRLSGAPVVDDAGEVLGVVSEADLVAIQAGRPLSRRTPLEWAFGEQPSAWERRVRGATTVAQAMTAPAVSVEPECPLREAAALMVDRGVHRLPVIEGGRLVGILTRADLVRAYLRRDDEILRIVRDDVIRGTMSLNADDLRVGVHEGLVHIAGTVDRRSTAGVVEKLIRLVEGVDGVANRLVWKIDDSTLEPSGPRDAKAGTGSWGPHAHPRG